MSDEQRRPWWEMSKDEIRARRDEIKRAVQDAKDRVEELERLEMDFYWGYAQHLPQDPRPAPSPLEKAMRSIWGQSIQQHLQPIIRLSNIAPTQAPEEGECSPST